MTGHDHDPEDLLRDSFRDRVDNADFAATPMSDVVSAARAIRRRRRRTTTLLATAAAVVAITVPTAAVLNNDDPKGAPPSGPSTSNPPPTPTPSFLTELSQLEHGPPPAIGLVDGGFYVAPDGTRTPVPVEHGISGIAPFDGGFLIADTSYFEGTSGLAFVNGDTREELKPCTSGSGAVSRDGLVAAWATFGCPESGVAAPTTIHRRTADGTDDQVIITPPDTNQLASIAGFLGEDVVFNAGFGQGGAFITDLKTEPREIPGLTSVGGVDGPHGLVAGQTGSEGRTGVIVDAETGEVVTTIHDWRLGAFSPDGRYVEATQFRYSTPPVAIFDTTTGEMVSQMFGGAGGLPNPGQVVWEDDTHLLIIVDDYRHQAIVRADTEGNLTLASEVVPRDGPGQARFVFAARP